MAKHDIHVVPWRDGWAVKRETTVRPFSKHRTKVAAVKAGRRYAKRIKVELVIHRRDGSIRASDSYGNDPYPPKG